MSDTAKLYYVSESTAPSVFDESVTVTFDDPGDGTVAETNPELLARILFKDDETRKWFSQRLFETAEGAARAYIRKVLGWNREKTDAEKLDLKRRLEEGLRNNDSVKDVLRRRVYSIDLPLADSAPELETLKVECCANCAHDYYFEDDGHEFHQCPFVERAKGLPTTRCSLYARSVPAIPVRVNLDGEETRT